MMFQKFSLQSHFHLAAWNLVGVSIMNSSTTESQISHSSKDTWRLLFWSKSALWASILNHFQVFSKDELDLWSHARVQLMSPRRHTSKLRFQNSSGRFSRCRGDNPNNHNGSLKKKKKEAIEQCDESYIIEPWLLRPEAAFIVNSKNKAATNREKKKTP